MLQKAQKTTWNTYLEKSNKKLERFAYICSHDIKEPLRSISNFIQLIQKHTADHPDPLTQDYLQHALTNVNRLQKLVQNILHYAHVTNANVFYENVPLDKILSDVLESLREKIQNSGAHIHISPLPCVYGDPTHFTQLFTNLIDNALKFCSNTPLHIRIYTTENDQAWTFHVKDNGIGIPKIYHQKIFNMFERLHDRRLYDGSGIGLSICKEITETYGGKLWVESDGKTGSCFIFVLPKSLTHHRSAQTNFTKE